MGNQCAASENVRVYRASRFAIKTFRHHVRCPEDDSDDDEDEREVPNVLSSSVIHRRILYCDTMRFIKDCSTIYRSRTMV